jgi:Zn-dependent protease
MFERIPPRERRDLLIAWLAISIAFTLIFIRSAGASSILFYFIISLVTVGMGFILHELAHKFMAMHYGFWAEFKRDNTMLLVAVAMAALAGIVFAAPGATMIYGSFISREQNGRISAAGPLTNLLICIPFTVLAYLPIIVPSIGFAYDILPAIGIIGLQVNAMIATFNMLPVSVLDGKKILAWNPLVFGVMIVGAIAVLYLSLTLPFHVFL